MQYQSPEGAVYTSQVCEGLANTTGPNNPHFTPTRNKSKLLAGSWLMR